MTENNILKVNDEELENISSGEKINGFIKPSQKYHIKEKVYYKDPVKGDSGPWNS